MPLTLLIASCTVLSPVSPILETVTAPVAELIVLAPPIMFLTLSAVLNNWLPLIASVELAVTAPGATLMIFKLPALIPVEIMLGPPVITTPFVSILVLPVVTLVSTKSSLVLTVKVVAPLLVVLLTSILFPAATTVRAAKRASPTLVYSWPPML